MRSFEDDLLQLEKWSDGIFLRTVKRKQRRGEMKKSIGEDIALWFKISFIWLFINLYFLFQLQESRNRRDGHSGLEEHDLVAPAPDRGSVPRAGDAAAADPAHRAAAQASEAGLVHTPPCAHHPPLYQRHATRHTHVPIVRRLRTSLARWGPRSPAPARHRTRLQIFRLLG